MFRSHRTGEVVDQRYTRFSFPPRWHYDVLRGLDHLRDVDAACDPAAAEAIEVVRHRRRADGRWPLQSTWPGKTWFELEQPREPSRWNTTAGAAGAALVGAGSPGEQWPIVEA